MLLEIIIITKKMRTDTDSMYIIIYIMLYYYCSH